tara:strand:+ start:59 stop:598 length:540 start_codon:yes stop_codon:yes gene_type:complete
MFAKGFAMADTYENKLQAEIEDYDFQEAELRERLREIRSRRDALAHALQLYAENKPRQPVRRARSKAKKRTPRFTFIMNAIAESGERGLTNKEMYALAEAAGYEIKTNTIRSQLYHQKEDGNLEHMPNGRYRLSKYAKRGESDPGKDEAPDASTSGASRINGGATTSPNESRSAESIFD